MASPFLGTVVAFIFFSFFKASVAGNICIIGAGVGGTSAAFFLRNSSENFPHNVHVFEARERAGGRADIISYEGDVFEAGASIIHEKNLHLVRFAELLGLERMQLMNDSSGLGIWGGRKFEYKDLYLGGSVWSQKFADIVNSARLMLRYGLFGLTRMQAFVKRKLDLWSLLYDENRDVYYDVKSLLDSVDLYGLTQRQLADVLLEEGLPPLLINELVTMIIRVNYGQNVSISGLAGAVGLAVGKFWAVRGGNRRIPEGLLKVSNATFHPNSRVMSVTRCSEDARCESNEVDGEGYILNVKVDERGDSRNESYGCQAVIVATPLEEGWLEIVPRVNVPARRFQHTHTTFVRGDLDPTYFGVGEGGLPSFIGTTETEAVPFSSINVLKRYGPSDATYKIFSRERVEDTLLDQLFRYRRPAASIDWAAYPHYEAPESFAPFLLDDNHLYYINTFESAASAMETAAVSAHNVVRLLLKRLNGEDAAGLTRGDSIWSVVGNGRIAAGQEEGPRQEL